MPRSIDSLLPEGYKRLLIEPKNRYAIAGHGLPDGLQCSYAIVDGAGTPQLYYGEADPHKPDHSFYLAVPSQDDPRRMWATATTQFSDVIDRPEWVFLQTKELIEERELSPLQAKLLMRALAGICVRAVEQAERSGALGMEQSSRKLALLEAQCLAVGEGFGRSMTHGLEACDAAAAELASPWNRVQGDSVSHERGSDLKRHLV